MKCLLVRLVLIVALVVVAKLVAAAQPVGNWVVDQEAMRVQLRESFERELAQVPAEQRAMLAPMVEAQIEEMLDQLGGSAEFRADGSAVFTDTDGRTHDARWEEVDGVIRLSAEGRAATMDGRLEGDRLYFRPGAGDPPGAPALVLILRRQ